MKCKKYYQTALPMRYSFSGDHSKREPPDPISNSEVKPLSADDSTRSPRVKVGHCQDFFPNPT
jgi:hypothetical protein